MKQTILTGIANLKLVVEGLKKPLVVCGNSFFSLSIREDVERQLPNHVFFRDFSPNPTYEQVCSGVDIFNAEQCDGIIAIGGGSAIDVAKCIKLFCRMSSDKPYVEQEYKETGIKLIAIPTTAGTGSESTRFSIICYKGAKYSVNHDSIVPTVAVLEPSVLTTLPLYQKKCTLLDALCQAIESWWSVNSTDESREYAREAIKLILPNWREYIFENTLRSAEVIMQASNLAGQAINITQTTAPHAFSYEITTKYGTPHGLAVAICLPSIWQYMLDNPDRCSDPRGKEYLLSVFEDIAHSMGVGSPAEAIVLFAAILSEMNMEVPSTKEREAEIEQLTLAVNPIKLKNNPVELSEDAIRSMYNTIMI